ncbi:hypothetical protein [Leifsonia sp. NPDC058230]|uniref:hypothetical protein n=1 Tax=Leifsonia sp. NPDC058230 TaxID=3346391 RepID=UPI0036DC4288
MDGQQTDGADETGGPGDDALVPRLNLIEDQPLAARAEAYAQVHDELREQLEGGDVQRNG